MTILDLLTENCSLHILYVRIWKKRPKDYYQLPCGTTPAWRVVSRVDKLVAGSTFVINGVDGTRWVHL